MSDTIFTASVAALTALVVAVLGPWAVRAAEASKERRAAAAEVNLRHLAPLRQQLAEAAVRNLEVIRRARAREADSLGCVGTVHEVHDKPLSWFAGAGCYLMSSAYFTACLFAEFARLREAYPFLRLQEREQDAELTRLVLRIHLAFRAEHGVYYAVQQAIGHDMLDADGRVATYPQFCQATQDPERGVWYVQLLEFYRRLAEGEGLEQLEAAATAMRQLSLLLDRAVGATASISTRLGLEAAADTSIGSPTV